VLVEAVDHLLVGGLSRDAGIARAAACRCHDPFSIWFETGRLGGAPCAAFIALKQKSSGGGTIGEKKDALSVDFLGSFGLGRTNHKDLIAIRAVDAFDGTAHRGRRSVRRSTSIVQASIDEDRALLAR
jgi:hypothetical protein